MQEEEEHTTNKKPPGKQDGNLWKSDFAEALSIDRAEQEVIRKEERKWRNLLVQLLDIRTPDEDQVMKHEDRHLLIILDPEPVYQGTGRSRKKEHHSSGERNQVFLHRFR
ncbi:hypothetical protein ILUMI_17028 [Ignelater luminosus]|uniref:Uncharacterized protein n=1 Tax=Ignelater luminosus TaxID=2038154 RepID=A0A8K0CKU7_IGNLU|nr:hypothetical protein ILUMI_17028 [Ignelater luminosus]